MRGEFDWSGRLKQLGGLAGKYKYVFLVILVGAALLLLPGGEKAAVSSAPRDAPGEVFDLREMEQRLERALSQVEGAGEVTVILTVKGSARQILAQDGVSAEKDGATEASATTVVVSRGSGVQEAVTLQQLSPEFQGALVVCSGGDSPGVRLSLSQAVAALTGLGADRISICKSK